MRLSAEKVRGASAADNAFSVMRPTVSVMLKSCCSKRDFHCRIGSSARGRLRQGGAGERTAVQAAHIVTFAHIKNAATQKGAGVVV